MSELIHSGLERRVYLGNVSWSTYLTLAESAENPRGRLAYDEGVLEIMSPSMLHESVKKLIGRMIEMWTFEKSIEVRSVSSTTFQRPDLQKGVEADECYYLGSVDAIQGVRQIDLAIHPPPDLVVEVDIINSSKFKLPIYAALGVLEVWRFDGGSIHVLTNQEGTLIESSSSQMLPGFPIEQATKLVGQIDSIGENELLRAFMKSIKTK